MPKFTMELDVEMSDGSTFSVVADQRDFAKFEVQSFGWPVVRIEENLSMGMMRFLAWSAATRQQLTTLAWPAFDAQCVEAILPNDEEGEPDAADDAGVPGQLAP